MIVISTFITFLAYLNIIVSSDSIFTKDYCALNICPKFSGELEEYLSDGCSGDFSTIIDASSASDSSTSSSDLLYIGVSIQYTIFMAVVSFLCASVVGMFIGKNYRLESPFARPRSPLEEFSLN